MAVTEAISTEVQSQGPAPARSALRRVANEVVGQVFYGTLLRQLRSSSLKGKYGHGGRGEEVFQAQLDQFLAERAGGVGRIDLADALVKRFERRACLVEKHKQQVRQMMQAAERERVAPGRGAVEERRW